MADTNYPMMAPISAIIATRHRPEMVKRTIASIREQSLVPMELIVVDASENELTKEVVDDPFNVNKFKVIYIRTSTPGAASQRMEGLDFATQPTIWFLDDDIILEKECVQRLWNGFQFKSNVGGVSAMITNQKYTAPGTLTRWMYRLMHGKNLSTYAGKVIGPGWNLLPEDEPDLPEYVPCEWLNTTCTMYLRTVLPNPVFHSHFKGYSLMEDVSLSLIIGRSNLLLNARTARIFHDSQPGSHKNDVTNRSRMELVNRHFVMTEVQGRTNLIHYIKLFIFELFGIVTCLRYWKGFRELPKVIFGKLLGVRAIQQSNLSSKR